MSHRTHYGHLIDQHTEREFRLGGTACLCLLLLLLVLGLAGCTKGGWGLSQGGLADSASAFGTDQATSFTCRRWDPVTGTMTDEVIVQRNLTPNAATVAAIAGVAQAAVAAAKAAPVAAAMGVRPGAAAPVRPLDVPACLGEHGVNTPMPPPPNPAPPDPVDHGDQPELMRLPERAP